MTGSTAMSFGGAQCTRCGQGFAPKEEMVNSNGEIWHTKCFVESGRAANPALGVGNAAENNLVMGIENLDVAARDEVVGLRENKFPVDEDDAVSEAGTALESEQGDFEPEGELKWQESGLQSQPMEAQVGLQLPMEAKVAEEKRGEDVDIVLGLKESPGEVKEDKPGKSGLKRQSSLQEARSRFQDIDEVDKNNPKQRDTVNDEAVPDSSYKYESTEVDTKVIRKRKSPEQTNGDVDPLITVKEQSVQGNRVNQDIEPIYQPYKKPEPPEPPPRIRSPRPPRVMSPPPPRVMSPVQPDYDYADPTYADPTYQTSFKQTERQEFETEETLSKFPTNLEFNYFNITHTNGRPPTEYVNGPPVMKLDVQQEDYEGITLGAQSGSQQRSIISGDPVYQPDQQHGYDGSTLRAQSGGQQRSIISGDPVYQSDLQLEYDGSTLRAQSGGQQRSIISGQSVNQPDLQHEYDGSTLRAQSCGQQRSIISGHPVNQPDLQQEYAGSTLRAQSGDQQRSIITGDPVYQPDLQQEYGDQQQSIISGHPVNQPDLQHEYDGGTLRAQSGGQQRSMVSGHSMNQQDVHQDYEGHTLRAQSGGQQRKVKPLPELPTKGYPLPERPMPQFGSKMFCGKCEGPLELDHPIVNYNGNVWHPGCFVCVQCFQTFPEGIFYEFEGRKYCEHDFHMLFAPCCGACGEFVVGRVIKAMNANWHPHCFLCELCNVPLADAGFYKNANRALCKECNNKEKAAGMGKYVCHKCRSIIEEGHIKFKGEAYHPYHFNCTNCNVELNAEGREKNGELFCLRCHDKMGIPICGACRRPIEERVVHALGKTWHVEHFVCAKCEKPFLGARHYEKRGLAYCEIHYHQLFGNMCFLCNNVIAGDVFSALNKAWCTNHFACYLCDKKLNQKNKFFEFDLKPVCKMCHEHFPSELKKRMKKQYEQSPKK